MKKNNPKVIKPKIILNGPPEDLCCDICGRKVNDLEPFNQSFSDDCKDIEGMFSKYTHIINMYITPDHKLSKKFRSFIEGSVEKSWECSDCFFLSNEEAVNRYYAKNRY